MKKQLRWAVLPYKNYSNTDGISRSFFRSILVRVLLILIHSDWGVCKTRQGGLTARACFIFQGSKVKVFKVAWTVRSVNFTVTAQPRIIKKPHKVEALRTYSATFYCLKTNVHLFDSNNTLDSFSIFWIFYFNPYECFVFSHLGEWKAPVSGKRVYYFRKNN